MEKTRAKAVFISSVAFSAASRVLASTTSRTRVAIAVLAAVASSALGSKPFSASCSALQWRRADVASTASSRSHKSSGGSSTSPVTWDPTARSIARSHARVASPTRVLRSSATHAARSFSKSSVTRLATARHVSRSDSPASEESTPESASPGGVCPGRRRLSSSGTASATAFAHSSRASLVAPAETNAKESFEAAIAFRNLRSSFSRTRFRCSNAMGLSAWTSLARSSSRLATLTLSSKYCASSSYPRSAMIACAASFNPRPGATELPSTELLSDASSRPSDIAASLAAAISSHLTVATITLCAGRSRSLSPTTAFQVSRRETTRPLAGTLLPSATGHRVSRRFGSAKRPYRALLSSMN